MFIPVPYQDMLKHAVLPVSRSSLLPVVVLTLSWQQAWTCTQPGSPSTVSQHLYRSRPISQKAKLHPYHGCRSPRLCSLELAVFVLKNLIPGLG